LDKFNFEKIKINGIADELQDILLFMDSFLQDIDGILTFRNFSFGFLTF
jgi:hypothetical protein